ncbi:MAG: arginine--tRNA ligase [Bacteroidia bacterium]|nr:arginine--tRNA ligase [Bacteroidia bacterium]MDW8133495.1 arginine--tRNA ligase [Bacteroidia bacterium]
MPFWHEQIAKWEASWREEQIDPLPRISLTPSNRRGTLTLNLFPLLKAQKEDPQKIVNKILSPLSGVVQCQELVKGFLNISFTPTFWGDFLREALHHPTTGYTQLRLAEREHIMVEYPSPNTNKPLHLGHLRNLCLGESVSRLWEQVGARVVRANLVNDRGIHISKSMLGWKRFFAPLTPQEAGKKGDHFVGDCYVAFEKAYRTEVENLVAKGLTEAEALVQAPLFQEAQALLRAWEAGETQTIALWRTMNEWVYAGFETTFQRLAVKFDRTYYESETYKCGKEIVEEALRRGIFFRSEDGAVWADLTPEGLGKKILLRRDGTSVYITQDLGTAEIKHREYPTLTRSIYVIGNEQDHHMHLLKALLKKLGKEYADKIYHLSYGMVELPSGRMKTREGTVVDADDLLDEMHARAYELTDTELSTAERHAIAEAVGQAAIRFYLLRVDPAKNIVFDPAESIDLKGFTGPFIQYGYVRAKKLLEKAAERGLAPLTTEYPPELHSIEESLLQYLYALPSFLESATYNLNPSLVAHYGYELTRRYNEMYQLLPVLSSEEPQRSFRLGLVATYLRAIHTVMEVLALPIPEKM